MSAFNRTFAYDRVNPLTENLLELAKTDNNKVAWKHNGFAYSRSFDNQAQALEYAKLMGWTKRRNKTQ